MVLGFVADLCPPAERSDGRGGGGESREMNFSTGFSLWLILSSQQETHFNFCLIWLPNGVCLASITRAQERQITSIHLISEGMRGRKRSGEIAMMSVGALWCLIQEYIVTQVGLIQTACVILFFSSTDFLASSFSFCFLLFLQRFWSRISLP